MKRTLRVAGLMLALNWSGIAGAQSAADSRVDSMLVRVRALVNAGNLTTARPIADSAVDAATAGTPQHGDALYWRGAAAATTADARRDLVRIAVEYPLSPTFPDALMKLADIERAAGDRESARRRLERIVRDHMESGVGARAALVLGEQLLAEGGVADACAVLDSARVYVDGAQVELANRIAYTGRQCEQRLAAMATPVAPPPTSPAPPAAASTTRLPGNAPGGSAAPGKAAPTGRAGSGGRGQSASAISRGPWSVQVAAYAVRGDALRLEARLKARGYDVRIFGNAPYRVRIGRFAVRAEAVAMVAKLKAEGTTAIVVDAERP